MTYMTYKTYRTYKTHRTYNPHPKAFSSPKNKPLKPIKSHANRPVIPTSTW